MGYLSRDFLPMFAENERVDVMNIYVQISLPTTANDNGEKKINLVYKNQERNNINITKLKVVLVIFFYI